MILYENKDDKIISAEDGFKHIINPDSDNEQIALYKNSEMFNNKESWSEEKYSCFLLAAFAKVIQLHSLSCFPLSVGYRG